MTTLWLVCMRAFLPIIKKTIKQTEHGESLENLAAFCPSEAEQGCGWVLFAGVPVQQHPALSSVVVTHGKPGLSPEGEHL